MDINLEKIELVKDRTGATYAEAKEALEKADGSVVDAIIDIEAKLNKDYESVDGSSLKDSPVFDKMKKIVDKGNVTRILVRKGDKTVVNFPLTAGVIGAVLVPWGAILGIVAALGAQCTIEFVDDKGEVIDINGSVIGMYDKAKEAAGKAIGKAKEVDGLDDAMDKIEDFAYSTSDKLQEFGGKGSAKVEEAWGKFEKSETFDDVREAFVKGTAKVMELWDKLEKSGKIDDVKETIDKVAKKAADTAKGIAKDASDRIDQATTDMAAEAEEAAEAAEDTANEAAEEEIVE
ncbi:MAG: DUF4342 domain-containing protein [Clostridiales bacterium]|nr:DUF4342 domain-containing protein [Clostridiales bacterium]